MSSTESEFYERAYEIVRGAHALEGDRRDEYIAAACGTDVALRGEVRAVLAAASDELADDPLADDQMQEARWALEGLMEEPPARPLPEKIGEYTVVRRIGQGGMGVVYEAEQDSPRRSVAIKLLHPMHETPESSSRFRREAQLLGRLQHPGIAQIFEAGTFEGTRGPQAFLSMELVEGECIDNFASAHDLDVAARLMLIARLCDALHYAHQKGVLHRDLKPANILVTSEAVMPASVDRSGLAALPQPKILDFGVARALDADLSTVTPQTIEGQLVGTVPYMSPEQAAGDPDRVDARSDVYAAGLIAYELLAGCLPYEVRGKLVHEAIRVIRDEEPSILGVVDPVLRGDVETIVAKALEKDRDRRYASAAELAADIRRHLSHEPIKARPPSTLYQLKKFTRRNRTLVGGVVATLVVALVGSVIATRFAFEATRRTKEVERQAGEIERQAKDVLRLSLAQDLEDLVATADTLWPPHAEQVSAMEDWLRNAQALTAELPALFATREELRAQASARTPGELQAERESHPDFALFELAAGKATFNRRVLLQRRDAVAAELPELDWDALPRSARDLGELARVLVNPTRTIYGQEPRGLVLAMRAFEVASDDERATIAGTVAQANLALGRDEEGLDWIFVAHDLSTGRAKADWASTIPKMEESLAKAATEGGMAGTEQRLAALEAEVAELDQRISERRDWVYPEEVEAKTRARWWDSQLTGLIGELRALNDAETGLMSERGISQEYGWSVARRLEFARRLRDGLVRDGDLDLLWSAALPGIEAAYPGLQLAPQMGLVPLGADPQSGLWEFWHMQTGIEPERGEDGKLVVGEDTGLVFVLLPGGLSWIGAQSAKPEARHYDPDALTQRGFSNEEPVHEVNLSPFFLAKYEMTQGQWERTVGFNPARWPTKPEMSNMPDAHPVEQITWNDCVNVVPHLGLALPTEAQWEYAARAGTDTPQPFAFDDFATHANIKDESYDGFFVGPDAAEPWDDGMGIHGPVGSFLPNGFGLHDVLGNVGEWCMDGYDSAFYKTGPRADPIAPWEGAERRMIRGYSFVNRALHVRSAARDSNSPTHSSYIVGLRPARRVD